MMKAALAMVRAARHNANALHVYCRLVDAGVPRVQAARIGKAYEWIVHRALYVPIKFREVV